MARLISEIGPKGNDRYPSLEAAEGGLRSLYGGRDLHRVRSDVNGRVAYHYWLSSDDAASEDRDRLRLPYEITP